MPQHALVVDDDLDTCKLIEAILRSADIEALISVDSVQAVELLGNQKFDAVFLDVNMPHPDGIELTRLLRASGHNRKTPVIIVTGDEDPAVLSRGFQAGANFFLFKPINKERLLNLARATHSAVQREKRHYQRVVVHCKVQVLLDPDVVEGETTDASLNGLLVRAARTFAVGSHVSIRLFLAPGTRPIVADGTVVRLPGPDMGLHLDNIHKDGSKRLQDFLLPFMLGITSTAANLDD